MAQAKEGVVVSQKNVFDILEEIGMTDSRSTDSPMDPNIDLLR